jgi:glycosyltransferase involved in cell wall biosynthesis
MARSPRQLPGHGREGVIAVPVADATPELPVRRRILLSSFACSPLWGSEPGVGWQWLLQLARHHDVVLLTHAYFREHLEPALLKAAIDVEVHYLQAPAFGLHPHRQLNSRLYYTWWQWRARAAARRLIAQRRFDLVHHLTWGTLCFPCFLGGLGVPLVMGPLGGGEAAPLRLFSGLPWRVFAFDLLRTLTLSWVRIDPLATWGPRRSALVLCKSGDSLRALPRSVQARAVVVPEIGSPEVDPDHCGVAKVAAVGSGEPRRFRLLFAGRLLGWKGVAIAVGSVGHMVRAGHDVHLSIAGEGPLREHLRVAIDRSGLSDRVELLGQLPRAALLSLYREADLFLFPSLHDSSGNVVLEALSRGLPVVCLDLGGPQLYVDNSCGVVVPTAGLDRNGVELALAATIGDLLSRPAQLEAMSRAALEHAARQSWGAVVRRAYDLIDARLGWNGASPVSATAGRATR